MKRSMRVALSLLILTCAGTATVWAQDKGGIELKAVAEQEVEVINESGEKEVKRVPAAKVVPGDEVIYTIYYTNVGQDLAEKVVITNPVPEHMRYAGGSALGEGAVITFSVDDGKTYDVPKNLKVLDADGKERPAKASEYTHVRWTLQKLLSPGAKGHVGFRAKLE